MNGWAMPEYIMYVDFEWVEPTLHELKNLDETSEMERMYEFDIK